MNRLKCFFGFHDLHHKPYGQPMPPFTLPRWVCKRCGKKKYRLTGGEE